MCQQHERFRAELVRAQGMGIKIIILIEHSNQIKSIEDVANWNNPRLVKRVWVDTQLVVDENGKEYWLAGHYAKQKTKAMTGTALSKIMKTMEKKYGCEFMFCDKEHTGKRIIELLGGEAT